MRKSIRVFVEELINSGVQTADEARGFYGVKGKRSRVDMSPDLERKILNTGKEVDNTDQNLPDNQKLYLYQTLFNRLRARAPLSLQIC